MKSPISLTLEQEFQLNILKHEIESLTAEQSRENLLEIMRQLMLKDNWIRHTFKECFLSRPL